MTYGYIRVSSKDQNEDRQRLALLAAGVPESRLIVDRQSGRDFNRPGYRRMCRKLRPGDTLLVKSIDRLGRNYGEILEQWRYLSKDKGVSLVVLDMPLLDTRQGKDLTGELISDIVLQLLSYVAQTEREFIHQRQAEGIAAARERGVQFGRPKREIPPEFYPVAALWREQKITARNAAQSLGLSHQTFLRWAREEYGP